MSQIGVKSLNLKPRSCVMSQNIGFDYKICFKTVSFKVDFKFMISQATKRGDGEIVETFFHYGCDHVGRPTTNHWTETIGINSYLPQKTDNFTQTLN